MTTKPMPTIGIVCITIPGAVNCAFKINQSAKQCSPSKYYSYWQKQKNFKKFQTFQTASKNFKSSVILKIYFV